MGYGDDSLLPNGYPIAAIQCLGLGSGPVEEELDKYEKCMCRVGVQSHCPKDGDVRKTTTRRPWRRTTTRTTTQRPSPASVTTTVNKWRGWAPAPVTTTTTSTTTTPSYTTSRGVWKPSTTVRPSAGGSSPIEMLGWGCLGLLIGVTLATLCKLRRARNRRRAERSPVRSAPAGPFPEPSDPEWTAGARTVPPPSAPSIPDDSPPPYELVAGAKPPPYEPMDGTDVTKTPADDCLKDGGGGEATTLPCLRMVIDRS
ncbi:uncharacterized protein LOC122384749 [Amphibalanus amphitrite]|uniref:uncharacterized protein LOC122384749 n=1 Tax=Amphibalanus amphitrite TaxID=1232801 RepID=UPI001C923FAA|nr:uncharacterized protein LOC122384749 [Amphibalanus amphitrite]